MPQGDAGQPSAAKAGIMIVSQPVRKFPIIAKSKRILQIEGRGGNVLAGKDRPRVIVFVRLVPIPLASSNELMALAEVEIKLIAKA